MTVSSQEFESYIPIYDVVPEKWEDARDMIVEQLKKISEGVNVREIGFFLDQELLSGKQFFPAPDTVQGGSSQQFRTILRIVVDCSPLVMGLNAGVSHGIIFDTNFSLIDMWVAGTNSGTLQAQVISGNSVLLNSTDIVITSPMAFDRAYCVLEYIQEI